MADLTGGYNMGLDFNQKLLEEAMGVLSGKIKVQDLPQYQFMKNMFMMTQKSQMADAMKAMTAKGVTGGPMATAMTDIDENMKKALLGTGQDIYGGMLKQGTGASGNLINAYQEYMQRMMQAYLARKNRKSQESQFKTKLWADSIGKGVGMAANFAAGGLSGGMPTGGSVPMGGNTDFSTQFKNYPWSWGNQW